MSRALLLYLPDTQDAPIERPWWEVADGRLVAHGLDSGWLPRSADRAREPVLTVGLVGPEGVRLERREPATLASAQARGVARLEAAEKALGEEPHVAVAATDADGWIATTDAAQMRRWLEWGAAEQVTFDKIVPIAALMPVDGKWHEARIGEQAIVARDGTAIGNEPALVEALVGEEFVDTLDNASLVDRLVAALPDPPIDLRQGKFALARRWKPDPRRLKEFAILGAAALLLALLIPLTKAIRWDAEGDRLDRQSAAIATAALGRPVEADEAETQLKAALGSGLAGGGAGQLIASLFAAMEAESVVRAQLLNVDSNGTLSARLVAPDAAAINRLLLALQQRGWSVTANPVGGEGGRAAADLTMRGAA